jgi:hypothetical protein
VGRKAECHHQVRRLLIWALFSVMNGFSCLSAAELSTVEQGQRIYQSGVLPNGELLEGIGVAGVRTRGQRAACESCHRKSGMGGREGSLHVSPVAGPILYAPRVQTRPVRPGRTAQAIEPTRQQSRSAYDDLTLVRAVTSGLDPQGRELAALMPRYQLDPSSAIALVAYLRQLSADPVPGFHNGSMHLATIIAQDADAERNATVIDTLTAWTRSGALGGLPFDLSVWRLHGPEDSWSEQLDNYYGVHPVFAVLSGSGGSSWEPVRMFCERSHVPCLFPVVDLGSSTGSDFYTVYFSSGLKLEARLLNHYLSDLEAGSHRLVQLVSSSTGEQYARQLGVEIPGIKSEIVHWGGEQDGSLNNQLNASDLVVCWMNAAEARSLAATYPEGLPGQIIFSGQLAPAEALQLPSSWRRHVRWISARSDPARRHGNAVIGLVPWIEKLQVRSDNEALLNDIYSATYFFGDALARMRESWSREYLMETLEASSFGRAAGGGYFSLSLGPGQREAAKTGYLLGFAPPDYQRLVPASRRLVAGSP